MPFAITSVDVKFVFVFVRSNSEKATNKRKNKKRKLEGTEGKTFHSSQTNSCTELRLAVKTSEKERRNRRIEK